MYQVWNINRARPVKTGISKADATRLASRLEDKNQTPYAAIRM